ncbi:ABC transporter substrate-binding protein, partial [Paraburkholderia sp. Se-20369]|nr:ABC transporter substrate-binding protein [Paraburkholderia sp. Se-20369]
MRPTLRHLAVAASLTCAFAAHPALAADDGGKITIMVGGIAKL